MIKPEDKSAPRAPKKPYQPPKIEKKRSVARVTLLSGMAVNMVGVGVINVMN